MSNRSRYKCGVVFGLINFIRDFLRTGRYYIETDPRFKTDTKGNASWPRTVREQRALVQKNGSLIFTNMTVRSVTPNADKKITQIHRYCVYEAFDKMGWLYVPYMPEKPGPHPDNREAIYILEKKLASTHNDVEQELFSAMVSMLKYMDEKGDIELKLMVEQVFRESKNRFGRKPIHHKLSDMGYHVSEKRIARIMKELGLEVARPVYKAEHQKPLPRTYFKNLLSRQFDQPKPNVIWVSDITYIKVGNQYYYICVILDLFSRKILSYSISNTIDAALSLITFDIAFQCRCQPDNLMFHSDQGVQYTAYVFRQHLRELKVKQSFSTPGNPYDNSVCESFFHTLKKEALYHHLYETPQELEEVLEEYIEFYNGYRPHRKLNMKTPIQYEAEFFSATEDK